AAQEQPRPVSSAATAVPARPFAIGVSMNNDQLESKDSAPPFVQTVQVATPGKEPLPTSEPTALKARIEQAESYDIEKPLLRQREPVIIPQGRKPLNAWEDTMRSQPAPNTPAILPITRPVAPGWRPTRLLLLATCLVFITLLIGGSVLAPNFFKELRGSAPQANALPSSLLTATARASVTSSSQSTVVPAEPAKGDYPMLGGNPAGTHQNAEDHSISPTNIPNLKLAWTGQTGGSLFSSPVIANGIVYIGSYDQRLYAYAAAGCSRSACFPLWSSAVTGAPITTSPAVAGGVVYITVGGRLYAYAAAGCGAGKTGCLPLWSSDPVEPPVSSPIIANGIVYFGSWDGKLYAYVAAGCGADKTTCAPLWSSELTGGPIQASPAVADGVVYIGSTDHKLYAYNAVGCGAGKDSCPPLWYSTSAGWYITTSPAVVDGIVYVSDRDTLYAYAADGCGMNATSCPPLWLSDATNVSVSTSPAVADGVVYVGGYNWLYAYKAGSDGTGMYARHSPLWSSQRMGGAILSPPFVANGIIYVSSGDHKLYAYNANVANCGPNNASCAPLWSSAPTGKDINLPGNMFSSPSIVNGVVYLGAGDGKLYAWHLPA
ncbi:MAG TPA: PQQ-binding-like beta-propeller repeat protein, partial [Ktedonobacteraceae bacterium]|nr:PQQ-binding-like beta-propeller repeat protein [Ktedonobacteraceae bacterium]